MNLTMGAAKAANLITNGSFEVGPVPPAGLTIYPSSGIPSLTGWTVGGSDVLVVNTSFTQAGVQFPAQDGQQWLDLSGAISNSATNNISQAVSGLNVGSSYILSFFVGSASNNSIFFPSTVNVSLGGVPQGSFTNSSATNTVQWQNFSINFTPTSTSSNIAFFNGSASNNFLGGLDNVTLALANNSVPVPTVTLAADTGLNPTDGITANGTVLLEGLEPGATWQYSIDSGTTWNNGSGSSFRLSGAGARSVIARQQDSQSNLSPASAPLSFFLDDGAGLRLAKDFAQLIYVAYYGRPADPGGVAFWNGVLGSNDVSYAPRLGDRLTGAEVNAYDRIVNDFGNSSEANNLLAGLSNQQKVDQVYQFCFNRNAELDPITGVNYWVDQLDRGNISLAQLSVEVALGAQGIDIVVFSNKIRSADSFSGAIDTPAELNAFAGESARLFGISYLDGFGETAAGPSLGNAALEQFLSGSGVFTPGFPI